MPNGKHYLDATGLSHYEDTVADRLMALVPVGTVLDYAGALVPDGYLECDGSAVSRSEYPALFAAIGTTWGAGNGSTTFNLPNLGGRVSIGRGNRSVGNTGGSETHTLVTNELPSHSHDMQNHTHGLQSHTHDMQSHTHSLQNHTHGLQSHTHGMDHSHRVKLWRTNNEVNGAGLPSTGSFANRGVVQHDTDNNSNIGTSYNSKTKTDGPSNNTSGTPSNNTSGGPSNNTTTGPSNNTSAGPSNNTTTSTGSGYAHNNMQPYAVVRKIIRAA